MYWAGGYAMMVVLQYIGLIFRYRTHFVRSISPYQPILITQIIYISSLSFVDIYYLSYTNTYILTTFGYMCMSYISPISSLRSDIVRYIGRYNLYPYILTSFGYRSIGYINRIIKLYSHFVRI